MSVSERVEWFMQLEPAAHDRPSWILQEFQQKIYASGKDRMSRAELKELLLSCGGKGESRELEAGKVDKMLEEFFSYNKVSDDVNVKILALHFARMELFLTIKYLRSEYGDEIPVDALYRGLANAAGKYQGAKMAKHLAPDRFAAAPVPLKKIVTFYFTYEAMLRKDAVEGGSLSKIDIPLELRRAVEEDAADQVELLLAHPAADANGTDSAGEPFLHTAIDKESEALCVALLHGKADPNIRDIEGMTALYQALNEGHKTLASAIITAGADVNLVCDGSSPLMVATSMEDDACLSMLLRCGADKDFKNEEGKTALDLAKENGDEEAIALLERVQEDAEEEVN